MKHLIIDKMIYWKQMYLVYHNCLQYCNTTSVISKWGTFSPFLSLVCIILLLIWVISLLQVKRFEIIPCLFSKCNPIFYFMYIYSYWRIISHYFFNDILKIILNIWYRLWSIRLFWWYAHTIHQIIGFY